MTDPELNRRRGQASNPYQMKTLVLLAAIGTLPAMVGIAASLPFWRYRRISNPPIFTIGLVVLLVSLIGGLIPFFMTDSSLPGFLCILVSALNLVIYRFYERFLFTHRCPYCGFPTLRLLARRNGHYKMHCRHCDLLAQWDAGTQRD